MRNGAEDETVTTIIVLCADYLDAVFLVRDTKGGMPTIADR